MQLRRFFLPILIVIVALGLVACGGQPAAEPAPAEEAVAPAAEEAAPAPADTDAKESPMLAAMVSSRRTATARGTSACRPLVVDPVEELGEYGGTWRLVDSDDSLGWTRQTIMVEPFLKWNRDASGMRPNLLESWEWNDDATELGVDSARASSGRMASR